MSDHPFIPNWIEIRERRQFVLRAWLAICAGLLGSKLWPVLRTLWTEYDTPWDSVLSAVSLGQLLFALVVSLWYAAYTEGKGAHTGPALEARLKRYREGGGATLFLAGIGLIDALDKLFGGAQSTTVIIQGGPTP